MLAAHRSCLPPHKPGLDRVSAEKLPPAPPGGRRAHVAARMASYRLQP